MLATDLEETTSSSDLIKRLKERFGSEHLTSLHQLQLNSRKQQANEGIAELAADVRRLSCLAYPWPRSHHSNEIETRVFVAPLSNREIALRVLEAVPADLDSAVRCAIELDAFRRAEEDNERHYSRQGVRARMVQEEVPPIQQRL